ncbi:M23 family metallopeptidase [Acinetobacter sp. C_4_1]|uniref:M23 family metallopeptidase n=1 Tax=unclassified Acinetobacter TaxID=196816 RepID=UPI0021B847C6|nr:MULTISPECIES: M23 family metallopeptidase [unclassified Acinetobacter]MCT8090246.1 M23 family metallopeptidase [Acinetobacter sp. F_3_1]MCT8098721.1 M23 family metallopeptidase [Acinetobacter sp. C_3_1]MCT8101791.1 M23 family metallopeptidase [Acinetobacter sp. C_4_1]MCT8135616.1 M23 family metallopeptidase [Acinetobacter sp. T_3_1]
MHTRRILLAFSLAASAASVAFADLVELTPSSNNASVDRIEQLTRTLAQGSYAESNDIDLPAETRMNVQLREKTIELNNESLAKKYRSTSSNTYSSNAYSWLVSHPLPDMKRVSSNFGGRTMGGRAENHSGLDLSAPSGTPIYATGPGVVTKSGWGTGYGQYVEINHGNGYLTRYAHASRLIARVGDRVEAGEHIANVGCTGRCTGPHLHYEVVKDGQRKNPSTYLAMLP